MLIPLGDLPLGKTVPFFFPAYDSDGASVTITGLAVTDIEIYKGTSMTQRSSDNGYALLDTDGIDLDGITGIHGFSVDMSDNSDSGFYAADSFYHVVVNAITVDGQTVAFVYSFSLGMNLRPTTAGRTLTIESDGMAHADVKEIEGSDATNQIRDSVVDDATRIDASALNTLSSHDPGETIMGATDLGTGAGLTSLATQASVNDLPTAEEIVDEWETQSQADPTGFHVNLMEWQGASPNPIDSGRVVTIIGAAQEQSISASAFASDAFDAIRGGDSDTLETLSDEIAALATTVGVAGAGLTALATQASVNTLDSVADAIKVTTDKLDDTLEDQGGGTFGFTEEALQEAGGGGGGDATEANQDLILAAIEDISADVYEAEINFHKDEANEQDEYTIRWFKNRVRVTSGITSPTLTVVTRGNSTIINAAVPTQIGSTGAYKHDATGGARLTAGEAAEAVVTATIDGEARTFSWIVGRDSTA